MNSKQHKRALSIIEKLMDKDPDRATLEGRCLRLIGELTGEYEKKRWPTTIKNINKKIKKLKKAINSKQYKRKMSAIKKLQAK